MLYLRRLRMQRGVLATGLVALSLLFAVTAQPAQAVGADDPVLNTECPATEHTMLIASDGETMVVAGNSGAAVPHPAVSAWEPFADTDPSFWELNIDYEFEEADWIWETYRVVSPVEGDIVDFERAFAIPGYPVAGSLAITVDNGYEAHLNGDFVGSSNLSGDWRAGNLRQPWVDGSSESWELVDVVDVTAALVAGDNLLAVTGVNEFMDPDDEFNVEFGNINNNPGGLIFELEVTYQTNQACVPCPHGADLPATVCKP